MWVMTFGVFLISVLCVIGIAVLFFKDRADEALLLALIAPRFSFI